MSRLHKKLISDYYLAPKEGQRDFLCSNKESHRCPSLSSNNKLSEDESLNYLASILVEAFLDKKEYERNN
ncbi:MAG: hypothetical protein WCI93_02555 [bacterium]